MKAFAGPLAGIFARDLIAAAADWRPDVVVRVCNEFGGYLAAERLDLPRAVLDIAPRSSAHLPFLWDTLNGQLVNLRLAPSDDPWQPNDGLLAAVVPVTWYPRRLRTPSLRAFRPNSVAPQAVTTLLRTAADSRRARYGRAHRLPVAPQLLAATVAALGELPCTGVVSLGPALESWTGPRPANVRLVSFAPQRELLGRAVIFLSHGGFGGVHDAVQAGTPMVNLPLFADQPDNARRVTELGLGLGLGLGLHVNPAAATPDVLADATGRVLADGGFRCRAADLARWAGAGSARLRRAGRGSRRLDLSRRRKHLRHGPETGMRSISHASLRNCRPTVDPQSGMVPEIPATVPGKAKPNVTVLFWWTIYFQLLDNRSRRHAV